MKKQPIEVMARTGYAARGIVYILIGGLTLTAAFGGGKAVGTKGALAELLAHPFGTIVLTLVAGGFLCFAAWRLVQALADADRAGTDRKGLLHRAGRLIGAVVNVALAATAVSVLFGRAGSDDGAARDWTAALLGAPFGRWLVGLVGAGVAVAGIRFVIKAWSGSFADDLALDAHTRAWTVPLGRAGYAARGVLFLIVAGFLSLAAMTADARQAKGLAGALDVLQQQSYGWVLLAVAAAGLFAFGAFMLVAAWSRHIDAPQPGEALRKAKHAVT